MRLAKILQQKIRYLITNNTLTNIVSLVGKMKSIHVNLQNVLIEIRSKIKTHRDIYKRLEYAVRKDVILPLLQALEWNIWDSTEVYPEFSVPGSRRVDYALCVNNNPKILVEVKNLAKKPEDYLGATKSYMDKGWTPYAIITNGARWIFIRYRNKMDIDFDITTGRIDHVSTKLVSILSKESISNLPYIWMPPPSWTKPQVITIRWNSSEEQTFETKSWMDGWRQIVTWLIQEEIVNEKPIYFENRRCIIAGNRIPFVEPKKIERGYWSENKKDPKTVWIDLYFLLTKYLSDDVSLEADWFESW